MRNEVLDAHLRLAMVNGVGPKLTGRLLDFFGDPIAIGQATPRQLKNVDGIGPKLADEIRRGFDEADLDREWHLMDRHGVHVVCIDDENYPVLLKHIHDPPRLLFVRGRFERHDAVALAMVGSRKCTAYGREQADRIAAACSQAGLTIISGGARGIDTAAHQAALRLNGRTIAVMGCGLSQVYPPENAELYDRIAEGRGAVVSEFPMATPPLAENFPRRNRIISGLALGVLVIEASARSGALITARLAAEDHQREVMALPGRIDSHASIGCHRMIREGWAALVTSAADILDSLGEAGAALREATLFDEEAGRKEPTPVAASDLSPEQARLFDAITKQPVAIDDLIRQTGISPAMVQSHLMMFQLRGLIDRLGGSQVKRRGG